MEHPSRRILTHLHQAPIKVQLIQSLSISGSRLGKLAFIGNSVLGSFKVDL